MRLRFSPRAVLDPIEIAEYLREANPAAAKAVRSAILNSLQTLTKFPLIGRRQNVEGVRKLITPKYHYLVYYSVDRVRDEIVILTIRHSARKRPYSDA